MSSEKSRLLNPKAMDGPVVKNTVADVFKFNNTLFMAYHVMGAGYDLFCPLGVVTGGIIYKGGYRPLGNIWQMMGTSGLIASGVGATFGLCGLMQAISQGENAKKIPWTRDGVQQRVDGLSHNYTVRALDLGVWSGIAIAAGTLALMGGPSKLGLSPGLFGVAQAVSIGSAAGSTVSIACIAYNKRN